MTHNAEKDSDGKGIGSTSLLGESLTLTGHQILELAAMLGGEDEFANETEITLAVYPEGKDTETGETMPAGLYAFYTDYPEEGRTLLPPNKI